MITTAKKPHRTTFSKLAYGARYWLDDALNVAPSTKFDSTHKLDGWNSESGVPTLTTVSPTTVAVVRVPYKFTKGR